MNGVGMLIGAAALVVVLCGWAGALFGGLALARVLTLGAFFGSSLQVGAGWLRLRVHGASHERFLVGFGRSSALRVFGGTAVMLVAFATESVEPAPFLAGFGVAYVVLEVVANVQFVRNEKQLGQGS